MREFLQDTRDFWNNRSPLGKLVLAAGIGYGGLCTAFTTSVVHEVIMHPAQAASAQPLAQPRPQPQPLQQCPREIGNGVDTVPYILPPPQPEPKKTMI